MGWLKRETGDMDDIKNLYDAMIAAKARKAASGTLGYSELDEAQRKAYHAAAMRETRAKASKARKAGSPEPTPANIRQALADAALILVATGADGAPEILKLLGKAFPGRAGVPGTVLTRATSGKLRPILLTPDRLRAS